jgi:hypothetical protein
VDQSVDRGDGSPQTLTVATALGAASSSCSRCRCADAIDLPQGATAQIRSLLESALSGSRCPQSFRLIALALALKLPVGLFLLIEYVVLCRKQISTG